MKVAKQLATRTVGTTKRSAKPITKKEKAMAARAPRKRQVLREIRSVAKAKAKKRMRGRPVRAPWVARKAWSNYD
jgi:hypothetical protein